ncbi:MAG: hypothetical protein ACE366_13265 [Bradymonadia bacterium]
MMRAAPTMGLMMLLSAGWLCAGCGGTQLNPEQTQEYEKLTAERAQMQQKLGQARRKADAAFDKAGSLEKRKKGIFKQVVLCGAKADGQAFGPMPFTGKKKARLKKSGTRKLGNQSCTAYTLEVKK